MLSLFLLLDMPTYHFPFIYADGLEVMLAAFVIMAVVWIVKLILSLVVGG